MSSTDATTVHQDNNMETHSIYEISFGVDFVECWPVEMPMRKDAVCKRSLHGCRNEIHSFFSCAFFFHFIGHCVLPAGRSYLVL
jgi:hypothetical protein